jgi:hypothetical protein
LAPIQLILARLLGGIIAMGIRRLPRFKAAVNVAGFWLECVVATQGKPLWKPYTYMAHPRCIPLLKEHFTALSVANNHSCDFGKPAFVEQCGRLENAGLLYFGGGRDKQAAHCPLIVERNGLKVALLEPGKHLGGMTSGGLSAVDIGNPGERSGLALGRREGVSLDWPLQMSSSVVEAPGLRLRGIPRSAQP